MPVYERKDFLSLTKFAKLQADELGDEPDLCLSLKELIRVGAKIAVSAIGDAGNGQIGYWWREGQWVYDEESGAGGWFFLTDECIERLIGSGGEELEWSDFIVDGELFRLASEQDVAKEYGLDSRVIKSYPNHFKAGGSYRLSIESLYLLREDLAGKIDRAVLFPLREQSLDLKGKPTEQHEWMRDYEVQHKIDTAKPLPDEVIQAYETAAIKVGMTKNIFRDRCRERDPKVRGIDRRTLKK